MRPKHTEGPWKAQGNLIFSADHTQVAKLFTLPRNPGESVALIEGANARLIAAAPEMLEALKLASEYLKTRNMAFREIESAIAKAEGRE